MNRFRRLGVGLAHLLLDGDDEDTPIDLETRRRIVDAIHAAIQAARWARVETGGQGLPRESDHAAAVFDSVKEPDLLLELVMGSGRPGTTLLSAALFDAGLLGWTSRAAPEPFDEYLLGLVGELEARVGA